MGTYFKATAGVLTALILWLSLQKNGKDTAILMTLAVCAMVIATSITILQPIVDFCKKIQVIGKLDEELLSTILKVVGIGMIGELCCLICKDAGNESMGKSVQFLSAAVSLWLSIPVFERLLSLLDTILGAV